MNHATKLHIPDLGPEMGDREMTFSARVTVNTCMLIKEVMVCGSRIVEGLGADAHRDGSVKDRLAEDVGRIDIDEPVAELFLDHVRALVGADRPPALGLELAVRELADGHVDDVETLVANGKFSLGGCRKQRGHAAGQGDEDGVSEGKSARHGRT